MIEKFCLFLFLKSRNNIYNFYEKQTSSIFKEINKNFFMTNYQIIGEKYTNKKNNDLKNKKWRYIVH
jgi:hypothetical protein